jgi:hypothetical protein
MPSLFAKPWHWPRKSEASDLVPASATDATQDPRVRISLNNTMISFAPALERSSARVSDSDSESNNSEAGSTESHHSSEEGSNVLNCSLNADGTMPESLASPDHDQPENQQDASELEQREESDFDEDAVFALTPETCPGPLNELETEGSGCLPLRVFAGTWNMAAQDPFAGHKGQYIGDSIAARELSEFLPLGYDLYVLGTQENVSKHLHAAVLARLNVAGGSYRRLELNSSQKEVSKATGASLSASYTAPSHSNNNDDEVDRRLRASTFGLVGSPAGSDVQTQHESLSGLDNTRWSFVSALDWRTTILQPHSASLDSVEEHLHRRLDPLASQHRQQRRRRRLELPGQGGEVRGRGDGAFLSRKSTSLAVYVASHWSNRVRVVATGAHKFSVTSGSKGGLGVSLQVAGDEQTLTFANCHLDANDECLRRQQLETLAHELPAAMGLDASDLASGSAHVVWMGDFNCRIRGLDADRVVELLRAGRHLELHDQFDSLASDLAAVPALSRFREPTKWPSFFPTYKKLPGRLCSDPSDPDWPLNTYRIRYKEPFYKGGRVKARVPAWCDRILVSSNDDEDGVDRRFQVEQKACTACGKGSAPRDNYRAANTSLRGSDHSPVSCTFVWRVLATALS